MKAAQFFGPLDIRVVDVPKPEPKEHEALVAIEWCGICGSDLHEYLHGPFGAPPKERPHPLTGGHIPVTLGHELAGRIISAPPTSNLTPGQPVVVDPRILCNNCSRCTAGHGQGCKILGFTGYSGSGGGFSEALAVDAKSCYPLPESADLRLAALIEPLAVAWHAVSFCDVEDWSSKSALVIGGGPIGFATGVALRAKGCKKIFLSEPTAARAAQNQDLVDVVFNPITDNVAEKCLELSGGEGVDVAFDCAGVQKGFDAAMNSLKFRGLYMNLAVWGTPMAIPFHQFLLKEIIVRCSFAYDDKDFKETVEAFLAGKFKGIEKMVTSQINVDDIVTKGFEELTKHKDDHIKILVTPKSL